MELMVDTSLLIEAERAKKTVVDLAVDWQTRYGEEFFALSAITLTKLAQGKVKRESSDNRSKREWFLRDVRDTFTVVPVSPEIAIRAGQLSAHLRGEGLPIGLADILIAATALELGFGVLTFHLKHFRQVPDLQIVSPIV